jgi:hypothetical protein
VERGEYLLFELKRSLEFLFDDGLDDSRDAELARLSESHTDTSTHDALAGSLEGFAIHANKHREALMTLPAFKAEHIDEAFMVAQRLREQSGLAMSNSKKGEQERLLSLRNRLVTLLEDRVGRVRRAARYVFREQPNIAKRYGSTYERVQRARRRQAARVKATEGNEEASV